MQSPSNCNYNTFCNKINDKYTLFIALLQRFPSNVICSNEKDKLYYIEKYRKKNNIALLNFKWLFYNEDRIWHLIFDIDKKYFFSEIKDFLNKKFSLTPTWVCYTDKGLQFGFMLTNVLKSNKQIELAIKAKQVITNELSKKFDGVDTAASNRIRGFWRNPLMHTHEYTGHFIELKTLKVNVLIPYTTKPKVLKPKSNFNNKQTFPKPKISFTRENLTEIALRYPDGYYKVVTMSREPLIIDNNFRTGNRNNAIFRNTMANTNSTNADEVLALAEYFNTMCEEPLEVKELLHIVSEVLKYNKEEKNYIFGKYIENRIIKVRTYRKNWELGKMGFEKIKGLSYAEYLEEVRKRQSKAGKEIGSKNLQKYNAKKINEAKEKVYRAIEELKKRNEKITAVAIAKITGISRPTTSKYLRQAKEEGII